MPHRWLPFTTTRGHPQYISLGGDGGVGDRGVERECECEATGRVEKDLARESSVAYPSNL